MRQRHVGKSKVKVCSYNFRKPITVCTYKDVPWAAVKRPLATVVDPSSKSIMCLSVIDVVRLYSAYVQHRSTHNPMYSTVCDSLQIHICDGLGDISIHAIVLPLQELLLD